MISLIVDIAVFFLVLFFVLPCVMMGLIVLREFILQCRRQTDWQRWRREGAGGLAGSPMP